MTAELVESPPIPPKALRRGARVRRGARMRSIRRHWQLYLLVVVPIVWFIVFKYIPMSNAILAFKDYNVVQGIWGSPWAGGRYFQQFFSNPVFWTLLRNTFVLSVATLIASFPVPIILALALNEVRVRWFRKTVQMVTYAPYFISTVVVVSMTILLLSPRVGFVNIVLSFFGIPEANFLGDPSAFRPIYVATEVWQTAGYSAVIYLAALAAVDTSLYEAARMDGVNRLQKIWHVDLPSILPTIVVVLILGVGNVMAIGFEKTFLFQNPLNLSQSEIIPTYVYKTGLLNADFSLATAVGLFNSVINLVLLFAVNTVAKRVSGSGLW